MYSPVIKYRNNSNARWSLSLQSELPTLAKLSRDLTDVFSLRPNTKPPHLTGGVQMRRLYCLAGATFRRSSRTNHQLVWGWYFGKTAPHINKLPWVDAALYCQIFWSAAVFAARVWFSQSGCRYRHSHQWKFPPSRHKQT